MREIICFQKVGDASRKVRSCHGIMIYRASNIYIIPPSKPAAIYVYIAQVDRPQKNTHFIRSGFEVKFNAERFCVNLR